ncbi:nucleotidyltransferase substrate binding protein [Carboxylicivirga mesophila]|uniref:Nucleotidyltransferase substrate binding protein n=1 Tax=Carboxylicivirga mesophila TaxID=1166478 RepID=A0ABS5KG23_9BACT|nr:nucleotidyltransferase substrate binding protein [Carboxylicivirga mesophila]MBS2214020.1 nucleotidyltransferase substrate binding protein [Carboxylicivirga mesophila]
MDELKDIRWQQRFANFNKAFGQLTKFIQHNQLNELEEQGLIKAFEYTYELAWKTLQDLLRHKGYEDIAGPKPVIEQSFQDGYIKDGKGWLRMHKSRNLASHTYDEATATEIIEAIRSEYVALLKYLKQRLDKELLNPQTTVLDE